MVRELLTCLPFIVACGATSGRAPVFSTAPETAGPTPDMALSEPANTDSSHACHALREKHACPGCECPTADNPHIRQGAAQFAGTGSVVEVDGTQTSADEEGSEGEADALDENETDRAASGPGESDYEKRRNPRPLTWRAWAKHADTGERFDALRHLRGYDRDGMVPIDGYLTIELELVEGPPPPLVVIRVNAKDSRYRQISRAFRGSAFRVGVPVRWRVSVGAMMQLDLECPLGGCRSATIFPLRVKPER